MRIYEKYAWVILLATGLLWLVVGIVAVFQPEGIFEADAKLSQTCLGVNSRLRAP